MKNETLLRVLDRGATAYGTTSVEYHKLLSSTHRFANSWLNSNPKHDYDKLSNQCVQDNLLLTIGLDPSMPQQYKCCSSPSPTSSPSDHATGSCGTKVHSAAGRVMKQASMTACSLLGLKPSNYEPKYADELSWTAKTQNQQIVRGDFSLEVNGGRVIVDSTFTSKYQTTKKAATSIGHSATMKENDKIKECAKNFDRPPNSFIPMGFESAGAWGDSSFSFLTNRMEIIKKDVALTNPWTWSKVTQVIGKAIRRANTLYLDHSRTGFV
jgi:hypothetical protein